MIRSQEELLQAMERDQGIDSFSRRQPGSAAPVSPAGAVIA
jgi:hypothetical protein